MFVKWKNDISVGKGGKNERRRASRLNPPKKRPSVVDGVKVRTNAEGYVYGIVYWTPEARKDSEGLSRSML